jgi:hypothetical protein
VTVGNKDEILKKLVKLIKGVKTKIAAHKK